LRRCVLRSLLHVWQNAHETAKAFNDAVDALNAGWRNIIEEVNVANATTQGWLHNLREADDAFNKATGKRPGVALYVLVTACDEYARTVDVRFLRLKALADAGNRDDDAGYMLLSTAHNMAIDDFENATVRMNRAKNEYLASAQAK
jgi:hypothetical protein